MSSYIYLASPYTKKDDPEDMLVSEGRYIQICWVTAELIKKGSMIFCPIAHGHFVRQMGGLSGEFKFWQKLDECMIRNSDGLWVCTMDGWKESIGVIHEIAYAKKVGKSVRYMNPKTLMVTAKPGW